MHNNENNAVVIYQFDRSRLNGLKSWEEPIGRLYLAATMNNLPTPVDRDDYPTEAAYNDAMAAAKRVAQQESDNALEECIRRGFFLPVARVAVMGGNFHENQLEETFCIAQTRDFPYWEDPRVTLMEGREGAASASVGDLFLHLDACALSQVTSEGFKRISNALITHLAPFEPAAENTPTPDGP